MTDPVSVPREAWGEYKRSQIAHLRPYLHGETLSERVSISMADLEAGSPKDGDMIARNPANHGDQWLVAADYFTANFEPALLAAAPKAEPVSDPYKLVTAADIIAWVKNHPHPTSWVATATDIKTIVETIKPDQLPEAPKVEQEPVAYVSRKGFTTGGLVWTKEGVDANLPDETKLYTHPAPASDELLEAIDIDDFNIIGEWIEGGENGGAPSGRVKGLWQSVRRVIALAKYKGPQS